MLLRNDCWETKLKRDTIYTPRRRHASSCPQTTHINQHEIDALSSMHDDYAAEQFENDRRENRKILRRWLPITSAVPVRTHCQRPTSRIFPVMDCSWQLNVTLVVVCRCVYRTNAKVEKRRENEILVVFWLFPFFPNVLVIFRFTKEEMGSYNFGISMDCYVFVRWCLHVYVAAHSPSFFFIFIYFLFSFVGGSASKIYLSLSALSRLLYFFIDRPPLKQARNSMNSRSWKDFFFRRGIRLGWD